ncbi:adenosine deaminase 2-like [Sitodiplosis mosellana]|uniref:adenosine deaminase 2-like n=1 Tax=Sitodiplosis mosellana TaxID=263140 RepID=UPI002444526F|nr:adenosine deaminase 2-like [Sitodiplosis mosellana]XP_055314978.1 adenosine deaminase 2-like [Sitodiplosis mosellana]
MNRLILWLLCVAVAARVVKPAAIFNRDPSSKNDHVESDMVDQTEEISRAPFDLSQYQRKRTELLNSEMKDVFGSDITLSKKEEAANKIIMKVKKDELNVGFQKPHLFNPSRHIFEVLDVVKESKLFQIIQKMPKGGVLHAHETALCSADYVVSLTYWPDLWQRTSSKSNEIEEFKFASEQPKSISNADGSIWRRVNDVRDEMGATIYDEYVRGLFTLFDKNVDPRIQFKDINAVWKRFMVIFIKIAPILTYVPVRKAYYKQALKQMYDDGVQYLEFRGSLTKLYDLDGNDYSETDILDIYIETLDEFKRDNPLFIGSKLVYAPGKHVSNEIVLRYFDAVRRLHKKYPRFLAGFDLVGQEDKTPGLLSFAEQILKLPADLEFFFHAGETNWFGSVDENLIDAVLLGSRRIGHGFALTKHPKLIDLVKSNDIAVEVNPISNQVLKLVDDYRNHPASVFMAQNVPIVISSDDPSFWEVSPLSHDFYITFLGIASRHSDLRTLKKLAMNSIQYSSLKGFEKLEAFIKWEIKWDNFIDDLIQNQ